MNRRSRGFLIDVLRQCDYILLGLCLVCSAFGLVMIASATRYMNSMRYAARRSWSSAVVNSLISAVFIIQIKHFVLRRNHVLRQI